jgi:hypothetical protein
MARVAAGLSLIFQTSVAAMLLAARQQEARGSQSEQDSTLAHIVFVFARVPEKERSRFPSACIFMN